MDQLKQPNRLTTEQQNRIIQGFDMVLSAVGATTLTELLDNQAKAFAHLPEDQQKLVLDEARNAVCAAVGGTIGLSTEELAKRMTPEKFKAQMSFPEQEEQK